MEKEELIEKKNDSRQEGTNICLKIPSYMLSLDRTSLPLSGCSAQTLSLINMFSSCVHFCKHTKVADHIALLKAI